jgi:hypothetical protein
VSVVSLDPGEITGGHIKIGAEAHTVRNILVVALVAFGLAGVLGFYRLSASANAQKLAALNEFRAAYASKCATSTRRCAPPVSRSRASPRAERRRVRGPRAPWLPSERSAAGGRQPRVHVNLSGCAARAEEAWRRRWRCRRARTASCCSA